MASWHVCERGDVFACAAVAVVMQQCTACALHHVYSRAPQAGGGQLCIAQTDAGGPGREICLATAAQGCVGDKAGAVTAAHMCLGLSARVQKLLLAGAAALHC